MSTMAQVSLEFTFMAMLVLFLATTIFIAANDKLADFGKQKDLFMLKDLTGTVRNEVQIAYASGPGYTRSFDLPQTLDGIPYSIIISNGTVTAATEEQSVEAAIQPVNGSIVIGANIIRRVDEGVLLN